MSGKRPSRSLSGRKSVGKEKSRYAAQVILYKMEENNWQSMAEEGEWSEIHVFCRNKRDQRKAYRVVAWVAGTQRVILNLKLEKDMEMVVSDDWGELRFNQAVSTYGMYFATCQQANDTLAAIVNALEELRVPVSIRSLAAYPIVEQSASRAVLEEAWSESGLVDNAQLSPSSAHENTSEQIEENEAVHKRELSRKASLSIKSAAESLTEAAEEENQQVSDFRHDTHVTFNTKLSRYEGLPQGWSHVNKQFGVEVQRIPRAASSRRTYEENIPTVLLMLEDILHELNGFETTGIFRVAPDKDLCHAAREAIDNGETWTKDVHVVATLIKQFFRDLPPYGLLNALSDGIISALADGSHAEDAVFADVSTQSDQEPVRAATTSVERLALGNSHFSEPHRSLCLWLLDLMADVVELQSTNRMTAHNMALVMSPNLYSIQSENPMAALTMAQKVADCTQHLLDWRLRTR